MSERVVEKYLDGRRKVVEVMIGSRVTMKIEYNRDGRHKTEYRYDNGDETYRKEYRWLDNEEEWCSLHDVIHYSHGIICKEEKYDQNGLYKVDYYDETGHYAYTSKLR